MISGRQIIHHFHFFTFFPKALNICFWSSSSQKTFKQLGPLAFSSWIIGELDF